LTKADGGGGAPSPLPTLIAAITSLVSQPKRSKGEEKDLLLERRRTMMPIKLRSLNHLAAADVGDSDARRLLGAIDVRTCSRSSSGSRTHHLIITHFPVFDDSMTAQQ
jgi:hypothetical protein